MRRRRRPIDRFPDFFGVVVVVVVVIVSTRFDSSTWPSWTETQRERERVKPTGSISDEPVESLYL